MQANGIHIDRSHSDMDVVSLKGRRCAADSKVKKVIGNTWKVIQSQHYRID